MAQSALEDFLILKRRARELPALEGEDLGSDVYQIIMRVMSDNRSDSKNAQVRSHCNAFWQSGSHDSNGSFILIEFWKDDPQAITAFINHLKEIFLEKELLTHS